ncbi:MAG TPA: diguanylate cyclase [Miltoncostaeaceae bacterium]|nr:diguanylate cyclase [Miltoncostaeaceae bacterium]
MSPPRYDEGADARRVRRLQRVQVGILVGAVVLVVALVGLFARQILQAEDRADSARVSQVQLVELRELLRHEYQLFWEHRALGGSGLQPGTRQAFQVGRARLGQLAAGPVDDPAEARARAASIAAGDRLGAVLARDYSHVRPGSLEDRRLIAQAVPVINALDGDLSSWIDRKRAQTESANATVTRLTRRLVGILVGFGAAILVVGVLLWLLVERARDRVARALGSEHRARGAIIAAVQDGLLVTDTGGAIVEVNDRLCEMTGRSRDALVGREPPYPFEAPYAPVSIAEVEDGERDVVIRGADGGELAVILAASPLVDDAGRPRGHVRTIKDITRRRRAEAELRGLAAEQAALSRVATAVAEGAEPDEVFRLVALEVAGLLGVEAGVVNRFDRQLGRAERVGVWVAHGGEPPPERLPLDGGAATARVFRTGAPARVDHYRRVDSRSGQQMLERGYVSGVAAPVRVGDKVWGAVAAVTTREGGLSAGAALRLARFAELVGLTVANTDARARLAAQAATDPLTGLANHRTFHERLDTEVTSALERDAPLSLVLLDLDHFKDVNDAFGHQVGDTVLAEAARRIAREARFGELVARIGGEEFAWILPGSDGLNAWTAAERVRRAMAARPFEGVGELSVSAGVCDLAQADGSADTLLRLADGALYWAKANGRDQTVSYSPDVVEELSVEQRAFRLANAQAVTALRALARAVDAKDPSTARHSERVAAMAVRLAHALGWSGERMAELSEAALLHDVGKIGVPDAVLFKPGRLTPSEVDAIRVHAALSAEIVSDVLADEQVAWVRAHHERWEGDGYPDGLSGDEIPDGARILAVADAWDAMTSVRVYGEPRTASEAMEEFARSAGSQFAPEVVAVLERLWSAGEVTARR